MQLMKTSKSKKSGASSEGIYKLDGTPARTTALGVIFISTMQKDLIPQLSKI
jgi:hypothetical protein